MIYCVEDDANLQKIVVYTLNSTGFEAVGFGDGAAMFSALKSEIPQMILLDIMLPGEDGLSILKRLRGNPKTSEVPIIMLTAKGSEYDKVTGLDNGADDYITKPFGVMELVSRVKAVLRRTEEMGHEEYTYGGITINRRFHRAAADGVELDLTIKEFNLLWIFIKKPEIVFTRDMLLEQIWGYGFEGETRTVDVHIQTLRSKLGTKAQLIKTVRGLGYKMGGEL